jgi:hypothetical protein
MQRYRVRTAAGERDHLHHDVPPECERTCRVRIPGKGRTVAFAGSKEARGFANAAHFADRGEVVGYVEEGLVGEDDVEGGVGKREAVKDVGGLER